MEESIPDVEAAKAKLKLLWISCGNKDGLIRISQDAHQFLKKNGIEHVWHVDGHGHDPEHWSSSLYWFAQSVFQDKRPDGNQPAANQTSGNQSAGKSSMGAIIGKWVGTINTQIGDQAYEYTIEDRDGQLAGTAVMQLNGETHRSELADVKLDGKSISFTEKLSFQGNELLITYTGEVDGQEMALTRKVGDFATENFVAKREVKQ
jgi:hypothetical protein